MKEFADVLGSVPGVTGWVVTRSHATETQRYLLADRPESERTVERSIVNISIQHNHDRGQGEAQLTLFGRNARLDPRRVEEAVFRASLQDNPPYTLPGPGDVGVVETSDPDLAGDARPALDDIQDRIFAAAAAEEKVRLAACEVFASRSESEILTSTGMTGGSTGTSTMMEFVLLSRHGDEETEAFGARSARRLADLDVEALVHGYATRARDRSRGELPETRVGPVVLSDGIFRPLLRPFTFATSGASIYRRSSSLGVGDSVFGDRKIEGDAFSLTSDPTLPYGTESRPYDGDGLCLRPVPVIESGRFSYVVASKRYADYLDIEPTGNWHNRVLTPGSRSADELLDASAGPILHVVEFSWLNPNAIRGTFATEIRLGYEISASGTRVIRGGSLSGNAYDAFANAQLSRETELVENYHGPSRIRFEGLQVTGA